MTNAQPFTEQEETRIRYAIKFIREQIANGRSPESSIEIMREMLGDGDTAIVEESVRRWKELANSIVDLRDPPTVRNSRCTNWYPGPSDDDIYWTPIAEYLRNSPKWSGPYSSIDKYSSNIIGLLDPPWLPTFTTKGLVVGHVQSGKTANFNAVIAKAADVNFRLIIVLSGITNALRKQTQIRIQSDVISPNLNGWITLSSTEQDFGDLPHRLSQILANPKNQILVVMKKNSSRLQRLLEQVEDADMTNTNVLIIDDEADQASINSTGDRERRARINSQLIQLIDILPRCCYVGYTATPFANVLINPQAEEDLYPCDFITSLPCPEGYFGPEKIFGRNRLEHDDEDPDPGMDVIRVIPDEDVASLQPEKAADRFTFALTIPSSLDDAVHYFWLACASRRLRGQSDSHSTMLVHTSSYVDMHEKMAGAIDSLMNRVRNDLESGNRATLARFQTLWQLERDRATSPDEPSTESWEDLHPHVLEAMKATEIIIENGSRHSDERIDYDKGTEEDPDVAYPKTYIVVGGSILSRGLTLEGLVCSYFLRSSRQYDTLLQMGRWFGYRTGYEDLPRIYMQKNMREAFEHLSLVEEEIRHDISMYEREGRTPMELAVRIRKHPTLQIAARNRLGDAVETRGTFGGLTPRQTFRFNADDQNWLQRNWEAGASLVNGISENADDWSIPDGSPSRYMLDVPCTKIIDFLNNYQIHDLHPDFQVEFLKKYINRANELQHGRLAQWTVCVISARGRVDTEQPLGALGHIPTVIRAKKKDKDHADIGALISRRDLLLDLDAPGHSIEWNEIHEIRQDRNPMLLLYPIAKNSQTTTRAKIDLNAAMDVLGAAFYFPRPPHNVDVDVDYLQADIPALHDNENYEIIEDDEGEES